MKICNDKRDCYGCGACQEICPHKAIKLTEDQKGFRYPLIDGEKCVECGLCQKVCPSNYDLNEEQEIEKIFGLKLLNVNDRMKSSSGGAFIVLARHIIEQGGSVFGAAFDTNMKVVHKLVSRFDQLDACRGSKYVQSNIEDVFFIIEKKLREDKYVLFSGTPCQCAAVKRYCQVRKIDTRLLYLCDIICHGVPSPKIWQEYCNFIQTDKKIIEKYNFREKKLGWHGSNVSVKYRDGTIVENTQKIKVFSNLYFSSLISRDSCSHCKYASYNRITDITIGDFWGCEKNFPKFSDRFGISLLMLHSQKSVDLFESCQEDIDYVEIGREACLQENLIRPVKFSEKRFQFWQDYQKFGFIFVAKRYAKYNSIGIFLRKLKNVYKKIRIKIN